MVRIRFSQSSGKRIYALFLILAVMAGLGSCARDEASSGDLTSTNNSQFQSHSCSTGVVANQSNSPLGTNIPRISYFNTSMWFFVDAFAKSSPWRANTETPPYFDNGTITSYDASGWPNGVANGTNPFTQMFHRIEGHYPAGTYVIRWDGSGGTIDMGDDAINLRCEDGNPINTCPTRRGYFDVATPTDFGFSLEIHPDNHATYGAPNYIRNIRILMPGGVCGRSTTDLDFNEYCTSSRGGVGSCGGGESCYDFDTVYWNKFADPLSEMSNPKVVYHPSTLTHLQKYHTLRFMSSLEIVGSTEWDWNSRVEITDHSGTHPTKGLAIEYTIGLGNVLNKDIWINLPHLANNAYATQMATLTATNLNSGLDVWVEYSNEAVNPDPEYTQSDYMLSQANANLGMLGLSAGDSDFVKMGRYYGFRTKEIHDLWRTAFGGGAARVKRVYGSFSPFTSVTQSIFDAPNVSGADVDAIAIAPYMGVHLSLEENESTVSTYTLNDVLNDLISGSTIPGESPNGGIAEMLTYITAHRGVIDGVNPSVELVAYEGGQHLAALGAAAANDYIQSVFELANRDTRMYTLYQDYFPTWQNAAGTGIMMHFHPMDNWKTHQGTFGAMEFEDSNASDYPKECALREYILNNTCWWPGC